MAKRKQLFSSEFERRLLDLNTAICYYFKTGKEYNLFPTLFKVFSLLWTSANVRLASSRSSDALRVFYLESDWRFEVEPELKSFSPSSDDSDLPF